MKVDEHMRAKILFAIAIVLRRSRIKRSVVINWQGR